MIIGIVGLSNSGKSTAALQFKEKGFITIDLDKLGHDVLNNKTSLLIQEFGPSIFEEKSEKINRIKLGRIIFANHKKRLRLNRLIHPAIKNKAVETIKQNHNKDIIIQGALLHQIGLSVFCDKVISVTCSFKILYSRARLRNPELSIENITNRLISQKVIKKILKKTDISISNNGSRLIFEEKIKAIIQKLSKESTYDGKY